MTNSKEENAAHPILSDPKKLYDATMAFPPGWWRIYEAFNTDDLVERARLVALAVEENEIHKAEVREAKDSDCPVASAPWYWFEEDTENKKSKKKTYHVYNPRVWLELYPAPK